MGFIIFFQSLASVLPCWICLPNLFNSISGSFHSWSLSVIIKQHISFQLNTLNSFPVLPSNLPGLLHQASYRGEKVRSYVLLPLLPSLLVLASLDIKSEKRKWEKYRGLFYITGCLGDTLLSLSTSLLTAAWQHLLLGRYSNASSLVRHLIGFSTNPQRVLPNMQFFKQLDLTSSTFNPGSKPLQNIS